MNNSTRSLQNKKYSTQLLEALRNNDHTLIAMTAEEFVDFAIQLKRNNGMPHEKIIDWIDTVIKNSINISQLTKRKWSEYKGNIKTVGSFLPVLSDGKILSVLAYDLHKGGGVFSKYRINTHAGKSYVVFKGYAGLRAQLTSTRYLVNNPKIVSMGVGKLGAANVIKGGIFITVIFSAAFHAIDQLLNDKATWHDFVAGVGVDVISAITGGAIAWGAVSAFVGGAAMAAIGPIALVVLVGAGITYALNAISDHYGLTEKVAAQLKEAESRMVSNMNQIKREVRKGLSYADEDPIGFMHRLFGVPYFRPGR